MLKDKKLKSKQQEINKIEADWSSAQKEIIKSKLSLSDAETDKLAREQSKNKLLAQCVENGRKYKYIAPLSSQTDVKKCYKRIKELNEQDQLSILEKEVEFKKALFSEMPCDFVYFKQYHISAKLMYENLLALNTVDPSNQEVITVEDIYVASESAGVQSKQSRETSEEPLGDFIWPLEEEEFVITLPEDGWSLGTVDDGRLTNL